MVASGGVLTEAIIDQFEQQGKIALIVDGNAYAIDGNFHHPGGIDLLRRYRGQDVTDLFYGLHENSHAHSKTAKQLLSKYLLVSGSTLQPHRNVGGFETKQQAENEFDIDETKALISQVGKLGSRYMDWIDQPSIIHPRFFQSDWAESLTKVHWWMVPLLWIPAASLNLVNAAKQGNFSPLHFTALLLAGIILWQFIEYTLHRFVFHIKPTQSSGIVFHFLLHGCHHKYPMDTDRLLFPPVPASVVALGIHCVLHSLLSKYVAMVVFGGILLGYTAYDLMHWSMHSGLLTGPLKSAHMKHHFVDSENGFGISSPLFDVILGTLNSSGATINNSSSGVEENNSTSVKAKAR